MKLMKSFMKPENNINVETTFFFILGAQRCGTTLFYNLLDEHPEICMAKPFKPEPKFFLNENFKATSKDEYIKTYYSNCMSALAYGEKSTSYIESIQSFSRIKEYFPAAKAIIILRDPAKRALSNFYFSQKNGIEPRTLEEVFIHGTPPPVLEQSYSVNPFDYLQRGNYLSYVKDAANVFAPSNLKIVIYEQLLESKGEIISDVYQFLGVNPNYAPTAFDVMVNEATQTGHSYHAIVDKLHHYYALEVQRLEQFLGINLSKYWS
jgi:hypothetical protein